METRKPSAKLSLDLDELVVHTFETDEGTGEGRGTVHGHATLACTEQWTCTWSNGDPSYPDCSHHLDSCGASCGSTCGTPTCSIYACLHTE